MYEIIFNHSPQRLVYRQNNNEPNLTMYKAMSQEGDRRLFHHLTEACEFASKSYHSVYRAFKLGKPVEVIEEVEEGKVHTISREEVFEEYVNAYWESEDCPFAMMEPDGSILFV